MACRDGRKVLRWAARGLQPQTAVKKVSVDTEIQQNAANSKRTDEPAGHNLL